MPSANVEDLRVKLDAFARARLTPADFDPTLDLDAELDLTEITPELFHALELLEPYGMGNPEPIFAARGFQLAAPPRVLKDKHVKLKVKAGTESRELSAAAILTTPSCHPDGAAIRREEKVAAMAERYTGGSTLRTESRESRTDFRNKITFDALGWHMAERMQKTPLLAGDAIDVAFTIGNNDHPEYGGLELSLRDFQSPALSD
jgi:single-stranded-DNA-specific exonuclease